ncbi:MAG: hypothetical protein R3284_12530, partial [Rubricoccaceae bacterium]|nr:hypothetical protein [Rubricoccaceae bacterium]
SSFLEGADEVTHDNCSSAFYRWTFLMPAYFVNPVLDGLANVDDQAVVLLNGHQITGTMTNPGCDPEAANGEGDPCYALQDFAQDDPVFDGDGRRILTWPDSDPFDTAEAAYFNEGLNELVFAVAGDASYFEPTGLEFQATVTYDLLGDADSDGDRDARDVAGIQRCFTGHSGGPLDAFCSLFDFDGDDDVDLEDYSPLAGATTGPR